MKRILFLLLLSLSATLSWGQTADPEAFFRGFPSLTKNIITNEDFAYSQHRDSLFSALPQMPSVRKMARLLQSDDEPRMAYGRQWNHGVFRVLHFSLSCELPPTGPSPIRRVSVIAVYDQQGGLIDYAVIPKQTIIQGTLFPYSLHLTAYHPLEPNIGRYAVRHERLRITKEGKIQREKLHDLEPKAVSLTGDQAGAIQSL
jgi:hypothetical protein